MFAFWELTLVERVDANSHYMKRAAWIVSQRMTPVDTTAAATPYPTTIAE